MSLAPIAIAPWFFAGSLFPIGAMPAALTVVGKVLPLTHALALMRYGLVDPHAQGLHDIWGMSSPTAMAALSLAVVLAFAAARPRSRPPGVPSHRRPLTTRPERGNASGTVVDHPLPWPGGR